jgi:hypothetical protein
MSIALAIVAAVALVAIVAVLVSRRSDRVTRAALAEEQARAQDLAGQLEAQRRAATELEHRAVEAERMATEAAAHAEAVQAMEPPDPTDRDGTGGKVADAFWELERIRLEREWHDVAGPAAPLPTEWDGSVRAALAVELEIVREVVGTPSSLGGQPAADTDPAQPPEPATAAPAVRVGAELIRELARSGDELFVNISDRGPGVAISVRSVASDRVAADPALLRLSAAAGSAGGRLEWSPATDGTVAQLWFPGQ